MESKDIKTVGSEENCIDTYDNDFEFINAHKQERKMLCKSPSNRRKIGYSICTHLSNVLRGFGIPSVRDSLPIVQQKQTTLVRAFVIYAAILLRNLNHHSEWLSKHMQLRSVFKENFEGDVDVNATIYFDDFWSKIVTKYNFGEYGFAEIVVGREPDNVVVDKAVELITIIRALIRELEYWESVTDEQDKNDLNWPTQMSQNIPDLK